MVSRKIVLHFSKDIWDRPIICHLSKEYDLIFNILKAEVTPREEGLVVMELSGKRKEYDRGIKYLKEEGVRIQPLEQDIIRVEETCIHCGACLAACPTEALRMEPGTLEVLFDSDKCIGCEMCIPACPPRAMEVRF
jgi:ferredoxin